jgi:hypothetical protein
MNDDVKNEALRLHKKYGHLAEEVARELKDYDQNDAYFWGCVISALQDM